MNDCEGWASFNKNFSFVRQALEIMCSDEFNVTGVLVANKNKANTKACTIPAACEGKIVQTTFLDQRKFFDYLSKVSSEMYSNRCFLFTYMSYSFLYFILGKMGILTSSERCQSTREYAGSIDEQAIADESKHNGRLEVPCSWRNRRVLS